MATLTLLSALLGFFFFYHTSKKATLCNALKVERWIQDYPAQAKSAGSVLFVFSLSFSIYEYGVGAGILTFSIVLITLGSLVVLLAPLKILSVRLVAIIIVCSFLLEMIVSIYAC